MSFFYNNFFTLEGGNGAPSLLGPNGMLVDVNRKDSLFGGTFKERIEESINNGLPFIVALS